MLIWSAKDPDEVVKRIVDWATHASWVEGDAIATANFSLPTPAGMSIDASEHDYSQISIVTLSGGTDGLKAKVLAEVTTLDGQTLQQTATMLLRAR